MVSIQSVTDQTDKNDNDDTRQASTRNNGSVQAESG
jgi:hypothetical protein